ncbi:PQQ-dependent sugar dehydrogenase [Amycolatopsis sp. EV170708-02-1]|uniref:PQQ-dependent sugar dehydrogenase n=1 Tax=Amycolatopsis sp. EV170708-02-1 TaxID=2919322 RepID=UPI001F0BC499|nr:PQQ-dependent sugar dehydrogenase [Amycolatopsis sp. EV170708-02-1]UMP03203.1 PQQ-dependent sugar dehydrogenase [Amycolatopsis sp. EV170708-02-1]
MPSRFRALCHALVTLLIVTLLVPLTSTSASAAPVLPPGFVLRDQQSGQAPYDLTDFAYLPDGSMLTTGKQGNVAWVSTTGQTQSIATLPVRSSGDLGLVGIAIAPDYVTSRAIYTARAVDVAGGGIALRASRWTVTGTAQPTGLTGEKVLIEGAANTDIHGITGVVAAPDGTVWVSTGDSSRFQGAADPFALNVYDLDKIFGKIFHITADGAGVPDNPYYSAANPNSLRSKVFASGFRSPFRFSLDASTGLPVVGDVGWGTWEEINFVQKGANLGWPCFEGNQPADGFSAMPQCASAVNTPPMLAVRHGQGVDNGNSITAGIVYNGESYPEEYRGAYFFGDYATQKLWTAKYDTQGRVVRPQETPPKFTGIGGPVKFLAAANGDIVYADIYSGLLRRLSYTTGNKAPVAVATSETNPETRTVTFDGSGSYDFDGDQLTYEWDFGDGTTGTGAKVSHTYAAGTEKFTAKLTVKDGLQASGSTDIAVAPGNHSPKLTMTDPGERLFAVGEEVKVGATVTDAEDGALPVTWTTLVRHCPENAVCHAHPDQSGTGAEFAMPFTDHTDSNLEFTATATDSAGVKVSKTYIAKPREHRLTLTSNVAAALGITPEGGASSAMVVEGAKVEIQAAEVASDGASTFTGWSNGATGRLTEITMGTTDLTITANYITPIDKRYRDEPALAQRLGAPTAPEAVDGTVRFRTYERGRLYWSKDTGVKQIEGEILKKYLALGGHKEFGPPATDEMTTPDTIGRYNDFPVWPGKMQSSIYYTVNTGAHPVFGRIRVRWKALGAEAGELGYPTTDEGITPDRIGRYNHFSKNASIYYTVQTDAKAIWGRIRVRWEALGWEAGPLGYPTMEETKTPDGIGRYVHFTKAGSIYWTMQTDAHGVYGAIRQRWEALGWENSYLRYPTTDEMAVTGGRQNNFQGGYVFWNASNGAVTDRRW